MFDIIKYLCQSDDTWHDMVRFVVWSIIIIDVAIIGFSLSAMYRLT